MEGIPREQVSPKVCPSSCHGTFESVKFWHTHYYVAVTVRKLLVAVAIGHNLYVDNKIFLRELLLYIIMVPVTAT